MADPADTSGEESSGDGVLQVMDESVEISDGEASLVETEDVVESDEKGEDAVPVFDLRCGACTGLFCRRGMAVQLVADSSARLFSTDFRPNGISEDGPEREHGSCRCTVRDVACACGHLVGYHVIRPCSTCSQSDHNEHYWQMNMDTVLADKRLDDKGQPITWVSSSNISLDFPSPLQRAESPVCTAAVADSGSGRAEVEAASLDGSELPQVARLDVPLDLCCPICYEQMLEPQEPPCGHAACLRCLTRAVDLRRECPCCRRPTTCSELVPADAMAERIRTFFEGPGTTTA